MRPRQSAKLNHRIFGTRATEDDEHIGARFEECAFHHIDADGIYFTRPMYDNKKTVYGPAPYTWPAAGVTGATSVSTFGTHTHTEPIPTPAPMAGDRLLIAWVTTLTGGFRPWVLGWSV
jgi:hypothetical protein